MLAGEVDEPQPVAVKPEHVQSSTKSTLSISWVGLPPTTSGILGICIYIYMRTLI